MEEQILAFVELMGGAGMRSYSAPCVRQRSGRWRAG